MGRNRSRIEWDEDEDGERDVFLLSAWELAGRARVAIEDNDALTLKDCFEAGASAEGLLELAAGAEGTECLAATLERLRQEGQPGCSAEALEISAERSSPGYRVSMLLAANAKDPSPLSDEQLGAMDRMREAMEQGNHGELFAWLKDKPARARAQMAPGVSALAFAADQGWSNCVAELILAGAPADERDEAGEGLLMKSLRSGFLRVADELAAAGAQGPLARPGEEREMVDRLREAGRDDWGSRVEKEWLDRQTRPSGRGGAPGRGRI